MAMTKLMLALTLEDTQQYTLREAPLTLALQTGSKHARKRERKVGCSILIVNYVSGV